MHVVYRPWLHRFAIAVVIGTFILIAMGGNVTSRGAGLAVPDGFTVYGHYLWSFPFEKWVGNIFHEHIHRLMGSLVGAMCIVAVLLAWLPRWTIKWPYRFVGASLQRFTPDASLDRPGVRWLSLLVLTLIITQGVLGALRVSEISTTLAVIHGVHAQLFLCLTVLFAASTSSLWIDVVNKSNDAKAAGLVQQTECDCAWSRMSSLRKLSIVALVVVLAQIVVGAEMRHNGAGLAIPDFPANMGGVLPHFNDADIHAYFNANPTGDDGSPVPTVGQVGVHFAHRIGALAVTLAAGWLIAAAAKKLGHFSHVTTPALALLFLLIAQIALGIAIILLGRPPNVATAHQALGAATFATMFLLAIRIALTERLEKIAPGTNPHAHNDAQPDAHAGVQSVSHKHAPVLMENAKA